MPTIHHLIVFVMAAIQFPQECAHACLRARVQLGLRRIFFLLLLDLHFEFWLVSLQFFCLEPIHPGTSTQEDQDLPLLHFLSLRPGVLQMRGFCKHIEMSGTLFRELTFKPTFPVTIIGSVSETEIDNILWRSWLFEECGSFKFLQNCKYLLEPEGQMKVEAVILSQCWFICWQKAECISQGWEIT